jgi:hypothetical protein
MFRLGFGVRLLSVEPHGAFAGQSAPERQPSLSDRETAAGREAIERFGIVYHAGNAAERHLCPGIVKTHGSAFDHEKLHMMLQWVEKDTAVEFAWCSYLWQRAYAFISDARQWRFVRRVADTLLRGPYTFEGREATHLLERFAADVERDSTIPEIEFLGQPPVLMRSPWHTQWSCGMPEEPFTRFEVLLASARRAEPLRKPERAGDDDTARTPPLRAVFSPYAAHALERIGIRSVVELSTWPIKKLASMKGIGPKTLGEVRNIVAQAQRGNHAAEPQPVLEDRQAS